MFDVLGSGVNYDDIAGYVQAFSILKAFYPFTKTYNLFSFYRKYIYISS